MQQKLVLKNIPILLRNYYLLISNDNQLISKYRHLFKNKNFIYILLFVSSYRILLKVYDFYYKKFKLNNILYYLPFLKKYVYPKLKDITISLEKNDNSYKQITELQYLPLKKEEIYGRIKSMNTNSQNLNISGVIYNGDKEHSKKLLDIFSMFYNSNPLHPNVFPKIKLMEIDIINIIKKLYNGNEDICGNITTGGTESIILVCHTYKEFCKHEKNIKNPNIVAIESVHPAFDKACHYFNIKLIKIPIDLNTGTCDPKIINKYIDSNTICLIASAPSYPHGIIDPIIEMNNIAFKKKINFHIDACMGGMLLPFLNQFNYINFNLSALTSISIDTHKYGYAFKGTSIVLYKNNLLQKYQFFYTKDWNGGIYATPTLMGSKSGAIISTCWASLLYLGTSEFKTRSILINCLLLDIYNTFKKNKYITIIGKPNLNIIAFRSDKICIYKIITKMKEKNWYLSVLQNPPSFHFCVTNNHDSKICDKFKKDLNECIEFLVENNDYEMENTLSLYGSSASISKNLFVDEIICNYISLLSKENISSIIY